MLTRLSVLANSLASILSRSDFKNLRYKYIEIVKESENTARINGASLRDFRFLFDVELQEMILRHTDTLRRTAHKDLPASAGKAQHN